VWVMRRNMYDAREGKREREREKEERDERGR